MGVSVSRPAGNLLASLSSDTSPDHEQCRDGRHPPAEEDRPRSLERPEERHGLPRARPRGGPGRPRRRSLPHAAHRCPREFRHRAPPRCSAPPTPGSAMTGSPPPAMATETFRARARSPATTPPRNGSESSNRTRWSKIRGPRVSDTRSPFHAVAAVLAPGQQPDLPRGRSETWRACGPVALGHLHGIEAAVRGPRRAAATARARHRRRKPPRACAGRPAALRVAPPTSSPHPTATATTQGARNLWLSRSAPPAGQSREHLLPPRPGHVEGTDEDDAPDPGRQERRSRYPGSPGCDVPGRPPRRRPGTWRRAR